MITEGVHSVDWRRFTPEGGYPRHAPNSKSGGSTESHLVPHDRAVRESARSAAAGTSDGRGRSAAAGADRQPQFRSTPRHEEHGK